MRKEERRLGRREEKEKELGEVGEERGDGGGGELVGTWVVLMVHSYVQMCVSR